MNYDYPFSKHYECLGCRKVSAAEEWDDATLTTLRDDHNIDHMGMTSIEDAMMDADCGTWFTCPSCHEEFWNDSLQIREVSFQETPAAIKYYSNNRIAQELLEESW